MILPESRLPPRGLIAWTDTRPGGQVFVRGKPGHILPDLRQNGRCGLRANPWNTHEQLHGLLKRVETLCNLPLHLLKRRFKEVNRGEDMLE